MPDVLSREEVEQLINSADSPVASIDFLPAILEMAGGTAPNRIDGVSIVALLGGGHPPRRDALFWHYPHYGPQGGVPAGAVRKGDWKLIEFFEDGRLELFHLKDDAGERRNLAAREPRRRAELHALLKRWRADVKAAMPQVNPNYDPTQKSPGFDGREAPTPPV